jgi:hypothetical protein
MASRYSRKCSPPSLLPLRAAHRALANRGLAWAFISRMKSPGRTVAEFPSRPLKRKHVSRSGCRQHPRINAHPHDMDVNFHALDPSRTSAGQPTFEYGQSRCRNERRPTTWCRVGPTRKLGWTQSGTRRRKPLHPLSTTPGGRVQKTRVCSTGCGINRATVTGGRIVDAAASITAQSEARKNAAGSSIRLAVRIDPSAFSWPYRDCWTRTAGPLNPGFPDFCMPLDIQGLSSRDPGGGSPARVAGRGILHSSDECQANLP